MKFLDQISVNLENFVKKVNSTIPYEDLKELLGEIHNYHLNIKESMANGFNLLD